MVAPVAHSVRLQAGDERSMAPEKPLRASLAEGLVDFLNDGPATRIDQHDAVARIHVAILGERRTPVSRDRFQFDVRRHATADHDLLFRGNGAGSCVR